MPTVRTFLISGLATASLITVLVVPTAAADTKGTLAIVNGIPGQKVDVCLDGKELKSGLKYGGKVLKNVVATGSKKLRFYKPDPRSCRGSLVARKNFPLVAAEDLTIVVTKRAPKIVIVSNEPLGEIPPKGEPHGGSFAAWRHAAEFAVNFKLRVWSHNPEEPIQPAVDPTWSKGQHSAAGYGPDFILQLRVTLPESNHTLALRRTYIDSEHRYEWIFVGTKPGNARMVFLDRVISEPTP